MAFTNSTQNLHLPQWLPDDKPTWLTDMNGAFNTIDGAFAGDRGSISNLDSRVTNQGITIASNTEAIHNNATQIVAINNNVASITSRVSELETSTYLNIEKPTVEGITITTWGVTVLKIGGVTIVTGRIIGNFASGQQVPIRLGVTGVVGGFYPVFADRVYEISGVQTTLAGSLNVTAGDVTLNIRANLPASTITLFFTGIYEQA